PTSKSLIDRLKSGVDELKDPSVSVPIPVDMLTTSASGLDPHITPAAAEFQILRIAAARGLSPEQLHTLINEAIEPRTLGIWGEPRINVLLLNMKLDNLTK